MFRTVDLCVGGILSVFSIIGSLTNLFSLYYFWKMSPQNCNGLFFKRLYVLICTVDFTICSTLFPMADAAFSPQRDATIFGQSWFCEVWGTLWSYLPIISIFLIAVLSVSRLLLLMEPSLRLNPTLAWLLPGAYTAGLLTLISSLNISHTLNMVYRPEWLACSPSVFRQNTDPAALVQPGDVRRGLLITVLFSSLPGLAIIPISVVCILSVVYLRRSARVAQNALSCSAQQQRSATVSVITLTLVYVVLNVPFSLTVFGGIILNIALSQTITEVTVHEYNTASLNDNPAVNNYSYFIMFYLLISLNSVLNPALYMWRMRGYRKFVNKFLNRENKKGKVRSDQTALQDINLIVSPAASLTYNSITAAKPLPTIHE